MCCVAKLRSRIARRYSFCIYKIYAPKKTENPWLSLQRSEKTGRQECALPEPLLSILINRDFLAANVYKWRAKMGPVTFFRLEHTTRYDVLLNTAIMNYATCVWHRILCHVILLICAEKLEQKWIFRFDFFLISCLTAFTIIVSKRKRER